jgi:hypothetical protein
MAYTTVNKATNYFNTKLYTGNGSSQSITGVGFQPDMVWNKARNATEDHALVDVIRGVTKTIYPSDTANEQTRAYGLTAFGTDGYTVGNGTYFGNNGTNYASWNWKAGNSQGSSNTDGSINTTYTSVSTTSGFSISQYTGTGSNATVGHGLGVAPKFIFTKCTSHTSDWMVYYGDATDFLKLNETNATEDLNTVWNDTAPTNLVFSLGSNGDVNTSGRTYIAYCFAEKTGFSKVGSYTGNGNANGAFVYTGFKPSWIMIKRTDDTDTWTIYDNKRTGFNVDNNPLFANDTAVESTDDDLDLLSNGFKIRRNSGRVNTSGGNMIYMAFAEAPLVGTNNIPATAR